MTTTRKKGRNPQLISVRNFKLSARYYWYSTILGLNTERCLTHLVEDFDLSKSTIYDIIGENSDIINAFSQKDVDVSLLKKLFPMFSWSYSFPASSSPSFEQWFSDLLE